jgi:hypothetical protein
MMAREKYRFPPFRYIELAHPMVEKTKIKAIRSNRLLIRPYKPTGYRPSGLWVDRNSKHPTFFAHVVALPYGHEKYSDLHIGSHVMIHRFADELLEEVEMDEPMFDGELAPICIIHVEAVQATFDPPLVSLRF